MRFNTVCKRIITLVVAAGIICTSGCFGMIHKDNAEDEMEIIARLLQEKYDEAFTIHNTWGDVGYSYQAECSPVAEPGIVFQAIFYIGEAGKLYSDEYPQGIVAWELEQLLQPEVQKISEDAYIRVVVFYAETAFTRREDVTIESYLEAIGPDAPESQDIMFEVYANDQKVDSINYEEVYSVLKEISKSITPNSGSVGLSYISTADIELCREFFKSHSEKYGDIKYILSGYHEYGTGITSGEIKESYEQFRSELEEIVHGGV